MASARSSGFASMLASGKYSDFTLLCNERVYKVHRVVLSSQSKVLAAAMDGNYQEAINNTMKIDEFDNETLEYFLDFLYTSEYNIAFHADMAAGSAQKKLENDRSSEVVRSISVYDRVRDHLKMNAIADYYDVAELKNIANQSIEKILSKHWSIEGFSQVLNEVAQNNGDVGLHSIIAKSAADNLSPILRDEEDTADALPPFAVEVLRHVNKSHLELSDAYSEQAKRISTLEIEKQNVKRRHSMLLDNVKEIKQKMGNEQCCHKDCLSVTVVCSVCRRKQ